MYYDVDSDELHRLIPAQALSSNGGVGKRKTAIIGLSVFRLLFLSGLVFSITGIK
nr:hypothetical protein [Mucilaginibacter sp. SP1R1]